MSSPANVDFRHGVEMSIRTGRNFDIDGRGYSSDDLLEFVDCSDSVERIEIAGHTGLVFKGRTTVHNKPFSWVCWTVVMWGT